MSSKNKKVNQEQASTSDDTSVVFKKQENNNKEDNNTPSYVVTRGGFRVSDKEYSSIDDKSAIKEKNFWDKVVKRYPDGTKVEIVLFDKRKHRIWDYED